MNMSSEMFGIVVTFVVLGSVLAVTGALTLDFDLGDTEIILPQINAGTSTATPNAYYDWCFKMNLDCG
jgi:hypothetical protein